MCPMRGNFWLLVFALVSILIGGSQAHLNTLTRHMMNSCGLAVAALVILDIWTIVKDEIRLRQAERRARLDPPPPDQCTIPTT